jgi:hypothetical protein
VAWHHGSLAARLSSLWLPCLVPICPALTAARTACPAATTAFAPHPPALLYACTGTYPTAPWLAANMPSANHDARRLRSRCPWSTQELPPARTRWHAPATAPLLAADMPSADRGTRRMPSTERMAVDTSRMAWKPGRPTNCTSQRGRPCARCTSY